VSATRAARSWRRRARRALLVVASFAFYVAAFFPVWGRFGDNVAPLAMVPVITAGWLFGTAAGLVAAALSVTLTFGLVGVVSPDPVGVMAGNALTVAAGFAFGGATGWVRQLLANTRRQARRLEQRHARALLEAGLRKAAEGELRRVNESLEKACDQAVRASDEKSRFLARASHELRTPLAAIQGYAELLIEEGEHRGAPPPTLNRDLGRIVEAARHLTGLVDELLDIAKIETGQLDVRLVVSDPREIVEEAVAMMQPAADAAGATLRVRCEPDVPPVRTDPRRARQVVLNLLSNAIKFTGEGDVAVATARAPGAPADWVEIEVRDSGPGIPAGDQQLVFEEFWRGRTDKPGVGLGLAIARRLCRELGGGIDVTNAPGEGAAFVVRLPVAAAEKAGEAAGAPTASPAGR
jgi:signal transduction histidine kinase